MLMCCYFKLRLVLSIRLNWGFSPQPQKEETVLVSRTLSYINDNRVQILRFIVVGIALQVSSMLLLYFLIEKAQLRVTTANYGQTVITHSLSFVLNVLYTW